VLARLTVVSVLVALAGGGLVACGDELPPSAQLRANQLVPAAAQPSASDNVVLQWNNAALQGVRDSKLGPPMVSRALAIVHTCMYDAWAAYDERAVGTQLGATLRRPSTEWVPGNVNKAVSFAAYRAAVDLLPGDRAGVFDPLMHQLGYDADDRTRDTTTAAGVGNVACDAVLESRHHDGANQLGDEPGAPSRMPYADYTGYQPANAPMDLTAAFDAGAVHDPARWQPLRYRDATGAVVTPPFVAPYWNRVKPFALTSDRQMRPARPPAQAAPSSAPALRQDQELIRISANLTERQKAIAEYWADGPRSELPPGHWNLIAQYVSRRDHHGASLEGVAADVKMFFALTNAVFDAGIVAWDNKIAFDSVRPITAIRYQLRGHRIRAWGGPGKGTRVIDGSQWLPYQPTTFPTPPFAEYASGHSNFSAAAAEVLRRFTGSDRFGMAVRIRAGSSKVEPGAQPRHDLVLSWDHFSDAAHQAGLSRRYGGIHFSQGDVDARATGRRCGDAAWQEALRYFNGVAAR
jgi:hypothetical protein